MVKKDEIKSILVLKRGALGDYIASTVVFGALREHFPNARITVVATDYFKNVAPEHTLIDELIRHEPYNNKKGFFTLIARLRKEKYDLAINLRLTSERDLLTAIFSGAKYTAGLKTSFLGSFYTFRKSIPMDTTHEYRKQLAVLEAIGITVEKTEPYIYISEKDMQYGEEFFRSNALAKNNTLLLSPFASNDDKAWKLERFKEVVQLFHRHFNAHVIVSYSPSEEKRAEAFVKEAGPGVILCPKTSVGQIAAITKLSGLCFCNNSGVMNIAMAVQTPLLVTSSASPLLWGAIGPHDITLYPKISAEDSKNTSHKGLVYLLSLLETEKVWETLKRQWSDLYGNAA